MQFILVMLKLNFQHDYSSLQCHMILQTAFWYADLLLKQIFIMINNDSATYFFIFNH